MEKVELNPQYKEETLENKQEYTLYKYRFLIVLVYIVATNHNIFMWSVLTPLQSTLVTVYDESITYVNFGTLLIATISFVPSSCLANYIIDTFGLRFGFFIGSLLTVIGAWIRCLSKHGFTWIFVGQCFAGLGQPYFTTTAQKISSVWFGPSERVLATTIMLVGDLIGNSVGRLIPQWFVDINADNQTILDQLNKMLFYLAIFGSVCFVLIVFLMREKPPTPPSRAAAARKYNFVNSLKTLVKNTNSLIMLLSTGIICSIISNYGAVIQQVVQPLGINGDQVADVLAIATFAGPLGSFASAGIISRYKKFKIVLLAAGVLSLIALVLNLFAAEGGNIYFYGSTITIYCVLMSPVLPSALEFGVELAFPVAEATLGGFFLTISTLASTILSLIIDSILGKTPTKQDAQIAFIIMAVCQFAALVPLVFVKENLKRTKYEKNFRDKNDEPSMNSSLIEYRSE